MISELQQLLKCTKTEVVNPTAINIETTLLSATSKILAYVSTGFTIRNIYEEKVRCIKSCQGVLLLWS